AGGDERGVRTARRGHADQQARDRHDAVVGAEHGGAQPADPMAAVVLADVLIDRHNPTLFDVQARAVAEWRFLSHLEPRMPEAVIVAYARTPIGRANKGSLVDCRPDDLSALIIKGVLARVEKLDPALVEDVLWGCGQPAG